MNTVSESYPGFGNEPLETPFENGRVIEEDADITYTSQDEHFAAVDRLVDAGFDSYDTAAEKESYDASDYEDTSVDDELDALFALPVGSTSLGVAVSLDERAKAVSELMDGINAQNRTVGAQRSGAIAKYGKDAGKVMAGMEMDAAYRRQSRARLVEQLAKTAALRAIGFDDNEALASQVYVNRLVSKASGTGPAASRLRKKQKDITRQTADKVFEQK